MKAASFSTSGFRQLDRLLAKMAAAPADRKAVTSVLRRGANVIAREERATIHVVSGRTRDSITVTTRPGFDIGRELGDVVVFVGPRKGGAGSRAHLLEWGTTHSPAYPFARPALDRKGDEAIGVIVAGLGEIMKAKAR